MSEAQTSTDRRTARRYALTLPLQVKFSRAQSLVEEMAQTRDVSIRGLYFHLTAPIEPGAALECLLTLPSEITHAQNVQIRCFARVVRVDRTAGQFGLAARIERYEFLSPRN
jgi:hypothetical protein